MSKVDLKKLMENLFIEDFILNEKYTYISQIGVITIKSLMPFIDELGVRVDYKRFGEELKLWKDYRISQNLALMNLEEKDPNTYWTKGDDSIISRILPIIIVNQNWEILKEEIIKNIIYTTGNIKDMFEYLSISYLIFLIIEKETDILNKLKEKIIGFAQVDFLEEYESKYKLSLNTYPGTYKVDFEKEKIQIISLLNGVNIPRYANLIDLIDVINKKDGKTITGKILYGFLYGVEAEIKLAGFYKNLGKYLENLRKGNIDAKQLKVKEYILPDVFSFNEGDLFFHTLLNESKVIKKEVSNNTLTSLVQTKTGMYLFKK